MAKNSDRDGLTQRIRELERESDQLKSAKKSLFESEQRLIQIIEGSSIATIVINKDHIITHCNRAFENLTGIPSGDIIGTKRQWQAFYPDERPVLADFVVDGLPRDKIARYYGETFKESAVTEGAYEAEGFFPTLGKEGKWIFFTAAPLRDSEGRITGAIETLQDITHRKRSEEELRGSQRRIRNLLDFVPYPTVVFTLEGRVSYVNPEFTNVFGWTNDELQGRSIPYAPAGLEEETGRMIKKLFREKLLRRYETRRLTKDGKILDVVMRAGIFPPSGGEPGGEIVILRDITREKRIARNNEAMLRISMALPEYPDLEDLLDYVSREVKELLNAEGALVLLVDEERKDLYFMGAAYDDSTTEERVKDVRVPLHGSIAGKVVRTGLPIIVPDVAKEPTFYKGVDQRLGYHTKSLLDVPLRSGDRIIGVLCARNKKDGGFEEPDAEILNMIAGTVVLSIENARFSEDLKKAYRTNESLLRISMALPEHPDLEELLDFISGEVKRLVSSEGSLVVLLDEERQELFFSGAAYDDEATQERVKEIRFPIDQLVAGKVIRTGKPIIVNDADQDPQLSRERDKKLGYKTRNLLLVPLRSKDRIIGVLCAINKKQGIFSQADSELLSMIAGTVALSIENARFSDELIKAYREVTGMNRAKDKAINHLSHELKTPLSVLSGSLNILARRLESQPRETWKPAFERATRNLERIADIQTEVEDIMQERHYKTYGLLKLVLSQCTDELETLVAQETGEGPIVKRIHEKIEEIFGPKDAAPKEILLHDFAKQRIEELKPLFSHREVKIKTFLEPAPTVWIPLEPLRKVMDGLVKNAVENSPDGGTVEIFVRQGKERGGAELEILDHGVGIRDEDQRRIFEGFFTTRDIMAYSSKRPFDFNAGGKGADLLRMKIFSERYNFKIQMVSKRCPLIPGELDVCPGKISDCVNCRGESDCSDRGGTSFIVSFPPQRQKQGS
ncbi:MAG: GAF domain-containing protein [Desulfobacteraceae bacterium]|nr:MAG: GAF domain-containing protein [Desulfobacteraceae bacterium]